MKLFGADTNSGMIQKISDWFGMNFNPKLSPGRLSLQNNKNFTFIQIFNDFCFVSESLRDYNGLSADLYKPSNYDKLALSLLSPLPNEQDFAINVCTLLSNEGKHTLRLDKYPRLVNILLAHAGVFDCPGTRQLFIEVYSRVRNYSINSFWSDVLDAQDVIDLTDERIFLKKPSPTPNTFSRRKNLEKDKSNKNQPAQNSEDVASPMEINVVNICLKYLCIFQFDYK